MQEWLRQARQSHSRRDAYCLLFSAPVRVYVIQPHDSQRLRAGDTIAFAFPSRRSQPPNPEARANSGEQT
jgi:hypothetical protein